MDLKREMYGDEGRYEQEAWGERQGLLTLVHFSPRPEPSCHSYNRKKCSHPAKTWTVVHSCVWALEGLTLVHSHFNLSRFRTRLSQTVTTQRMPEKCLR
jgi:hypothetical protein